ncbi:hypothetical protein OU789_10830 [Halocynthiibacter sp. C4]|uniref:hypothetical protein n=1 Tax=Halocynthiibacter sp. C4 TaxID=2992758 RepID=UPI00237C1687|nr:hypothetical protein [Halocynthiibacter sp. C4]MDE0590421.1 hypothetical protein [Halocynthiibacter sp. C4]
MPLVEFTGQTVQEAGNPAVNSGRLINFYREIVMGAGKTTHTLQSVLGQAYYNDIGAYSIRGMGRGNEKNYLAGNGKLYEMTDAGGLVDKGNIADDENTTISGNYSDVTIVCGGNYYVWDGATISEPATKTFAEVGSHCYVGGYTVITELDGKRFQWSDLGDAQTLDALNFASMDKVDDNITRAFELQGNLMLMGPKSTELWQVTGAANTEAFAYVSSWNRGLKDFNLLVKFDDTVLFVGDDNNAYIGAGGGAVDVTTPGLNAALTNSDATHCFYYEDRGHKFCVIRFSDRPAWVFDVKMREWHERAEGAGDEQWRATHAVYSATWDDGAAWVVGNEDGEVLRLSRTNKDLNGPLRRTAISSPIYIGDRPFTVNKLEINARVGSQTLNDSTDFGLSVGDGFMLKVETGFGLLVEDVDGTERNAIINLYESRDGGYTWSTAKPRSMGKHGDYTQRMVWWARGQYRQYAAKLVISEPADMPINTTAVLEVV